jgi:hypothetical protein
MNDQEPSIADRLDKLISQRKSYQIGEWEFEKRKRETLQLPPAGLHPIIRNLLAYLIINCICLGLALAFPAYAKIVLIAIGTALGGFVSYIYMSSDLHMNKRTARLKRQEQKRLLPLFYRKDR